MNKFVKAIATLAVACGAVAGASQAQAAVTIVINNINAAGVGFNDTTPAAPVGGNPGTTLGAQRLYAFTYAANIWGATLTSNTPIVINAQFTALTCTATSATLGSAGATRVYINIPGAAKTDTLYSYALANKIYGAEVDDGAPQINARFNSNLGNAGCLTGTPFYLGVDGNHGPAVDFVEVLLHEMGHGLGFQTFTNGSTGAQFAGYPSIWDYYLLDTTIGKYWVNMTDAERAASGINSRKLVWDGANVKAAVPNFLQQGVVKLNIGGANASTAAGDYIVGVANFGPAVSTTPVTGQVMPVIDTAGANACNPLSATNALAVKNNIAIIDRGTCGFIQKVKNAQAAGAIGVIIADNAAGSPAADLGGGPDNTVTIPAIRVTQADGNAIKARLTSRTRTASGVIAAMSLDMTKRAGADSLGRAMLYTPNPYQSGSSVSHFDTSAFPNLLMEPAINGDLNQTPYMPKDMTFELLKDIGW